jgi:hypothetical protein
MTAKVKLYFTHPCYIIVVVFLTGLEFCLLTGLTLGSQKLLYNGYSDFISKR